MIADSEHVPEANVWDEEELPIPDVSDVVTEDDTPVDNLFSEKQMRLLTESIHASWKPGYPFVAMANVGVFVTLNRPPVVPDVLVTTRVRPLQDPMKKDRRAYFTWMYEGKVPDIVIEIVSNTKGNELGSKMRNYEHIKVTWYAVYDPAHHIQDQNLSVFSLSEGEYVSHDAGPFGEIGLGLIEWDGEYEGVSATWLRWVDRDGAMLKTGKELAASEAQRAEMLAAKLRELGIDPSSVR